jgi:Tfp pilus assembly PilM family ATPase
VNPSDLMSGPPAPSVDTGRVVATALNDGIRRIASEVRHSLDFYLAGRTDTPVSRAMLCGPALEIPGFTEALSRELGIDVMRGEVALASPSAAGTVPLSVLPVAAGLSVADGPV